MLALLAMASDFDFKLQKLSKRTGHRNEHVMMPGASRLCLSATLLLRAGLVSLLSPGQGLQTRACEHFYRPERLDG